MSDFEARTFGDVVCLKGDCLDVMPTLPQQTFDLIFCDIPYGKLKNYAWDVLLDLKRLWSAMATCTSPKAAFLFTSNMRLASALVLSNPCLFKYDIVWQRHYASNFMSAKRRLLHVHENILLFAKSSNSTFNPQMRSAEERIKVYNQKKPLGGVGQWHRPNMKTTVTSGGPLFPISVFKTNETRSGRVHPTQKPVALLEWLIATYTNPGDLILDPVAGSGTTGVAALNLGRRAVLIEKDPTYFEVMCKRIAEHQAKLTTSASNPV